jgi:cysteine synthase B
MTHAVTTNLSDLKQRTPLLQLIGNTPLLEIAPFEPLARGTRIFAKAEWRNPGGSIKDRPVMYMLARAIEEGRFEGGQSVLDSSSGNAGIAYAMLGAALSVPVTLVVPGNASEERKRRILAHGAKLILTDPLLGYDEALRTAHHLAQDHPEKYFLVDQYANESNVRAHYETTGAEILEQTRGEITHFISGIGTGGTLTGVGRRLKEFNERINIVQVVPEVFPGIEGLKPLEDPNDIRPKILDESLVDQRERVTIEDAWDYCNKLASRGIFVGQSSGAYIAVAHKIARKNPGARIVTVFPDTGERYFSTRLWDK